MNPCICNSAFPNKVNKSKKSEVGLSLIYFIFFLHITVVQCYLDDMCMFGALYMLNCNFRDLNETLYYLKVIITLQTVLSHIVILGMYYVYMLDDGLLNGLKN